MQAPLSPIAHRHNPLRWFFLGRLDKMDLSALAWWNHQRLGYNLRLLMCLIIGQCLFLWAGMNTGEIPLENVDNRIRQAIPSDVLLMMLMNLLYFLMPWLESVFGGRPEKFRTYGYAFINALSLLFVVFASLAVMLSYQRLV